MSVLITASPNAPSPSTTRAWARATNLSSSDRAFVRAGEEAQSDRCAVSRRHLTCVFAHSLGDLECPTYLTVVPCEAPEFDKRAIPPLAVAMSLEPRQELPDFVLSLCVCVCRVGVCPRDDRGAGPGAPALCPRRSAAASPPSIANRSATEYCPRAATVSPSSTRVRACSVAVEIFRHRSSSPRVPSISPRELSPLGRRQQVPGSLPGIPLARSSMGPSSVRYLYACSKWYPTISSYSPTRPPARVSNQAAKRSMEV